MTELKKMGIAREIKGRIYIRVGIWRKLGFVYLDHMHKVWGHNNIVKWAQ